jgi:2,4-dienoyl-CoA reductase-like NADH-dependent reductase (Old Yellow Enzyme family)/thioredoxin reductase
MFDTLFEKGTIGRMEIKNRIVLPPMVRNYATESGEITQRILAHYEAIAEGGVGTIIVEAAFIHPTGRGFFNQIGIHNDSLVSGLSLLAERIKRHGVRAGIQIHHAGRQTSKQVTGGVVVAPSPVKCPLQEDVPREMSVREIEETIEAYADAARRAREAGFDFVEIHGGHGYLITQFLSPLTNRRNDTYGGTFEGRMRFAIEVVNVIREKVGNDYTVTIRLSGDEYVEGGYDIEYAKRVVRDLERHGIDAFHISGEIAESFPQGRQIAPMAIPPCPLVHLAREVKTVTEKPVIAVGKISPPESAEDILLNGYADFIATGRWLLADPQWPNKVRSGDLGDINYCISCNQGCIDRLFQQKDVWCLVNPWVGREKELSSEKADSCKNIMVIGGGPAGMQAAWTAAARGHRVTLYEKVSVLGGQFGLAKVPPKRHDIGVFIDYQINKLKKSGVKVVIGREATVDLVREKKPDFVVVAAGSDPYIPGIKIAEGVQLIDARALLGGGVEIHDTVIVAGGGMVGCEVAEYVAEMGKRVKVVEQLDTVASDCGVNDRYLLLKRLAHLGVEIYEGCRVEEITARGVRVSTKRGEREITGRTVVICMGSRPRVSLVEALKGSSIPFCTVGDCRETLKGIEAVYDGTKIGCTV